MLKQFKKKLLPTLFKPGLISLFINPFFLTRRALYNGIKKNRNEISGNILDVGCGIKPYQQLFNFTNYTGIETGSSGHDHQDSKVDIYYDGKKIPFGKDSFDSVISTEVLEHIFEPKEFLNEINRVLRPGGKLLLTVPFIWDEHEQPCDFGRYTSFGLIFIMETAGFKVNKPIKTLNNFSAIFQLANCYFHKLLTRKRGIVNYLILIPIVAINNILGLFFGSLLPNNNDLYMDNIIIAQKQHDV
jgi:SAM-dependent methyltransferase